MTAQNEMEQARWNWLEVLMDKIPVNYLLVSYVLFILLFSFYYIFSLNVIAFQWQYNMWYVLQSLAQCFLIAYLIAGLIFFSGKTRSTFKRIDLMYGGRKHDYFAEIEARVTGARSYHLLLLLSVAAPFIIISWGQWPYYDWEPDNWARALDIYNYLLSFLILALLTELLWLIANIVWSVNEIGCVLDASSAASDIFSIGMKMRPLKNFFMIFILYYFIAIALIIYTYVSPSGELSYEMIYFVILLLIGGVLFVAGLEANQRMINCRMEIELEFINKWRDEQYQQLVKLASGGNLDGLDDEIEYTSRILDLIHKERESILQINRRAYDIESVSLFLTSFLIPLLTLVEKLGLI